MEADDDAVRLELTGDRFSADVDHPGRSPEV